METIRRFIDPEDRSVAWNKEFGAPTQAKVEGFLKTVLRHDLLDQRKRPLLRKSTYLVTHGSADGGDGDRDLQPTTLDDHAAHIEGPLDKVVRAQQRDQLLQKLADDPEVREMLEIQLEPGGYNAYTNQELAELLGTDVPTVENRKKRAQRRLVRMLAEQEPE